jgi:hypothetical protein
MRQVRIARGRPVTPLRAAESGPWRHAKRDGRVLPVPCHVNLRRHGATQSARHDELVSLVRLEVSVDRSISNDRRQVLFKHRDLKRWPSTVVAQPVHAAPRVLHHQLGLRAGRLSVRSALLLRRQPLLSAASAASAERTAALADSFPSPRAFRLTMKAPAESAQATHAGVSPQSMAGL